MGKIYQNIRAIKIPDGAFVKKSDMRVNPNVPRRDSPTTRIGTAVSDDLMYPNDNFSLFYPDIWCEIFPKSKESRYNINMGMYLSTLAISYKIGLYPILVDIYGPIITNQILDYVNYSLLYQSNVSMLYEERMKNQLLLSSKLHDDTYLSNFFKEIMDASKDNDLQDKWLNKCKEDGSLKKIWLSIDGSNIDCLAKESSLAKKGHAKSKNNAPIIGFIEAIDAISGRLVCKYINEGGVVDCKAFKDIANILDAHDIQIEGVIIDRGFCSEEVLSLIKSLGYKYVLMLRSNTNGHQSMLENHKDDIRWKIDHLINEDSIFAIQDKYKIFNNDEEESNITLFFDGVNASERSSSLIKKIFKEINKAKEAISNKKSYIIKDELRKYIKIENDEVIIDKKIWQSSIDSKGYASIASNTDYDSKMISDIYDLRDASEKQFSIIKSQLGYDVTRVHKDKSIINKINIGFIASIIRNEIRLIAKCLGVPTNTMIEEINDVLMVRKRQDVYVLAKTFTERQKQYFKYLDVNNETAMLVANEYNDNLKLAVINNERRLPLTSDRSIKKKPGRPKGSKNESYTLNKRRPGRPKKEINEAPIKRGRGRPRKHQ